MPTRYVVAAGENLSQIATKHGFSNWKTLYNAEENADFRALRPDPNRLRAGDVLFIPDKRSKQAKVKSGQSTRFKLAKPAPLAPRIEFTFVLKESSIHLQGLELELLVPPDGQIARELITDSDGFAGLQAPDIVEGTARLTKIRDPNFDPEKNYDSFGGDFATGHSHVIELPADPITASLPHLIAFSERRPRLAIDGTTARDMLHGDYTKQQLKDIRTIFVVDDILFDLDTVEAPRLFQQLRFMATTLFSTGDLEENATRMIDRFEANTGADYEDPVLTAALKEHASTQRFVVDIKEHLAIALKKWRGDVSLVRNDDIQELKGHPHYNDASDIVRGLTFAMNDTQAYDVHVTEYGLSNGKYQGKFTLTVFDHFGLDQPDVQTAFGVAYGVLGGFRAWFILQHLDRLGFRPFLTRAVMEFEFAGQL